VSTCENTGKYAIRHNRKRLVRFIFLKNSL
jgi:hypothetical protein